MPLLLLLQVGCDGRGGERRGHRAPPPALIYLFLPPSLLPSLPPSFPPSFPPSLPAPKEQEEVEYVGCFSSESMFLGKDYTGGAAGANFNMIRHVASQKGKR